MQDGVDALTVFPVGTDGSDFVGFLVDNAGSLNVNVVSGGTSGMTFTEGVDNIAGEEGTITLFKNTSDVGEAGNLDASGNLLVNVAAGGTAGWPDSDPFMVGADEGSVLMGLYEISPTSVSDGQAAAVAMTTLRAQHAFLVNNSGLQVGTNANPFVVDLGNNNDVAVTSTTLGTGASSLGKQVDGAWGGTHRGVFGLHVRNDNNTTRTDTDGDYSPLSVDLAGRALVNPIVGQQGVQANEGMITATTQRVTLATDDDIVGYLNTLQGAVDGSEMQVDIVGSLPSGSNSIGIVDTELPTAALLSDTTANPTAPMVGAAMMAWDGSTNWVRVEGDEGTVGTDSLRVCEADYDTEIEAAGAIIAKLAHSSLNAGTSAAYVRILDLTATKVYFVSILNDSDKALEYKFDDTLTSSAGHGYIGAYERRDFNLRQLHRTATSDLILRYADTAANGGTIYAEAWQ